MLTPPGHDHAIAKPAVVRDGTARTAADAIGPGPAAADGSHGDFRGWITTIARNRAMDHLRRASRQPPAVPVPVEDLAFMPGREDTADRAIEAISTEEALRLIAALPRDQAEAVLLRAVVGLDAARAAQVAGKRAGAIRTAAYRGLKTIEQRIDRGPDHLG